MYSDFRYQKTSNPDGYEANTSTWLRALVAGTKAGLVPASTGNKQSRFVLHSGEELSQALQTQEFGRPLALGAAIEDAVRKKEFIQLKEFTHSKQSIYARSWVPTPWQMVNWTLRQLGVVGGDHSSDRLVAADFVVMSNVEVRLGSQCLEHLVDALAGSSKVSAGESIEDYNLEHIGNFLEGAVCVYIR